MFKEFYHSHYKYWSVSSSAEQRLNDFRHLLLDIHHESTEWPERERNKLQKMIIDTARRCCEEQLAELETEEMEMSH